MIISSNYTPFTFDFEFVDTLNGGTHPISLAVVHNNCELFYAEFCDFPEHHCDEWLQKNVLSKLLFHKRFAPDTEVFPNISIIRKSPIVVGELFLVPNWAKTELEHEYSDGDVFYYGTTKYIREKLIEFIEACCFVGESQDTGAKLYNKPEFIGWYCAFDWYLFSKMFGRMIDIQSFFPNVKMPFYPIDLKPLAEYLGIADKMRAKIKTNPAGEHSAFIDALEIAQMYNFVTNQNPNR